MTNAERTNGTNRRNRINRTGQADPALPSTLADPTFPSTPAGPTDGTDRLTVHGRFREQARLTPDRTAVFAGGVRYTYEELDRRSDRIALRLIREGIGRGQTAALLADRTADLIAAILGVLKAGAAYLPLDPGAPAERIRYMLADSGAPTVLLHARYADLLAATGYSGRAHALEDLPDAGEPPATEGEEAADSRPDDLIYTIYTSGTTGRPKGVLLEHRNVLNLMRGLRGAVYDRYSGAGTLNVALVAPYYFDASVQQIFAALLHGHALYIVPEEIRADGRGLLRFFREHGIDIADGTPAHLKMLTYAMEGGERPAAGIRHLIIGGEELTWAAVAAFRRCWPGEPPAVTNIYGPTECCVDSLAYTVERTDAPGEGSVPIGRPLEGQAAYVLGPDLRPAAEGETGELYLSGAGVGRGYAGLPERTRQSFLDDPFFPGRTMYRTGDLARRLPDGNLLFLGRVDHQVKIRGYRIELGEIRSRLLIHPSIREAEVVPFLEADGTAELGGYYVADGPADEAEVRAYLAEALPGYMIPACLMRLERMPLTSNGKLDRGALPRPGRTRQDGSGRAEPRNDAEEKLLTIWREALGSPDLGIDDSFFEWGGHSLAANRLAARIGAEFGVELPLSEVFRRPTVRELAAFVEGAAAPASPPLVPAGERDEYPASAAQRWMYVLSRLDRNGTTWNMPGAFRIDGPLDAERFREAARMAVERHDIFRTRFEWRDDGPVQVVERNAAFEMPVSQANGEEDVERLLRDRVRPFDIGRAPLIRLELIELSETSRLLFVDAHHLVFDGASIGPFLRELADAYAGKPLPPPALHYRDFAVWERSRLTEERLGTLDRFWTKELEGDIPSLDLPTDYPRPPRLSGKGGTVACRIDGAAAERVRKLAAEAGASPFMLLLAAFNALLHRYTGRTDIVAGTLSAGRSSAAVERMPGMFVQTLSLRSRPVADKTFRVFLNEVKETVLRARAHEDYPADRFQSRVGAAKPGKRGPLFDVMFNYLNYEDQELSLPGLTVVPYPIELHSARFDLVVEARETKASFELRWTYSADLFREESVRRMSEHYRELAERFAANPDAALGAAAAEADEGGTDAEWRQSIDFIF